MSAREALNAAATIFPDVVTNEFINSMPRRELSKTEKKLPYAKYYFKDMAPIPQEDLDAVNAGPIDPALALPIRECSKLLDDGYLPAETGFCVTKEGCGYAATKVFMPNVTTEMIDWWFNWHPLEGLRYAIWCPVGHDTISAKTPEAHLDSSNVPLHTRNIGKIHYPVEGFSLEWLENIEIAFRKPEVLGLTQQQIDDSPVTTFEIATCTAKDKGFPINIFFHSVRKVPGGIEYRSRYWQKYLIKKDRPVKSWLPLPTKKMAYHMARCNCIHSLTEYNNLASFLPELYNEMDGRIDEV